MARALWVGSLRFGLVHVPVQLHTAVTSREVRFHLLHDADGARIQQRRVCSRDGQEVPWAHLVKGYEVRPGRVVELTRGELEAFEARASRSVDVEDFVPLADIDPLHYDATYHLVPAEGAGRAYALLAAALRETGRAGVGRLVLRGKGHLCAVRAFGRGLVLSTLHWADEVVSQESFDALAHHAPRLSAPEQEAAVQVVRSMATDFDLRRYHDSYRERLLDFIERRARGLPAPVPAARERPARPPASLLEALRGSVREEGRRAEPPPERGRLQRRRAQAAREARVRANRRRAGTNARRR